MAPAGELGRQIATTRVHRSSMPRITPEYEDFLAEFVRRYPAAFWQLNFMGLVGGAALGVTVVEAVLFPQAPWPGWVRLLVFVLPAAVWAQLVQRRYRQRAARRDAESPSIP
jgi:uncharacterized membrane protein YesL